MITDGQWTRILNKLRHARILQGEKVKCAYKDELYEIQAVPEGTNYILLEADPDPVMLIKDNFKSVADAINSFQMQITINLEEILKL